MKRIFSLLLILCLGLSLNAQTRMIGFYNVENLFDTLHDQNKNDHDYLPDNKREWNTEKYLNKLQKLSYAISRIGEGDMRTPHVLGLCEIENRLVLDDLVSQPELQAKGFSYIMEEGPDTRGIDVALIYQRDVFKPIYHKAYPYVKADTPSFKTRDQLLVCGELDTDTIYIIVNHWPSRVGGQERSAPNRMVAAQLTKKITDEIFAKNVNAKILIMGDFNDDPTDTSMTKHLNVLNLSEKTDNSTAMLYNPGTDLYLSGKGSLEYRGKWNLFDQIIISKGLVESESKFKFQKYAVFNEDFLLQQDGRYKGTPWRTFGGANYLNGYSDHLPVYVILSF